MSTTLREMLASQNRLADSVFEQAAANNRLTNSIERLVAPFEQLRRDIYDIKTDRETDGAKVDIAIAKLNTDLALLLDNVKDAQGDVKTLTREVTGAHLLPPREARPSKVVEAINAFEKLSVTTKLLVLLILVIAAFSGWLTHWIGG